MGTVYKRGETYYITYRTGPGPKGQVRKAIGPKRKEADAELNAIMTQIREGTFVHRPQKKVTLKDAVRDYLKLCATGKNGKDKTRYISALLAALPNRDIGNITMQEIESHIAQRAEVPIVYRKGDIEWTKPRSVGTINREFANIRHFFNRCRRWGWLILSPCEGITRPKEPKGRTRYLTVEEASRLIGTCGAHLKPIIIMALETGMRKAELLRTKWENVDYNSRSIFVPQSKSGESRHVPMSERLADVLKGVRRRVGCAYVFADRKGRMYGDVKTAFETACAKAGILDFRFHDLRHTAASHMAMAGVPMKVIGEILGHKVSATTARYAHLSETTKRDAVNQLPEWERESKG